MTTIFKEGDQVKILKNCSGAMAGQIYTVVTNEDGKLTTRTEYGVDACSCQHNWELIIKKEKKMNALEAAAKALKKTGPKKEYEVLTQIVVKASAVDEEDALEEALKELESGRAKVKVSETKAISAKEII